MTKKLKVIYNYWLVRLGIHQILPAECIRKVKLEENNEPLVRVDTDSNIVISDRLAPPVYLRKTVYEKLKFMGQMLEEYGYRIKLYDAYRSFEDQQRSWDRRYKETKEQHPDLPESEIERLTRLKVSKITDKNNVGGHQTGGAIDITLVDKDGKELNMGTRYAEHNSKTKTKSNDLTVEEKSNRDLLVGLLEKLDFVNFPNEWWHFAYGDKMWAAYKFKRHCFYGYIEPDLENKKSVSDNDNLDNIAESDEHINEKKTEKMKIKTKNFK
ncbi:MAG: D-alanyl-D-alanine carboxypeptidase family protein [Bacilli bacterium]|nr:D-alanyl-D-alanine carboxypeptidase family protein [Bacilli bacterium]